MSFAKTEPVPHKPRRSWGIRVAVGLMLLAVPCYAVLARIDHGEANVISTLIFLTGFIWTWVWLIRRKAIGLRWRQALALLPLVILGLLGWRYEFVGFSGELIPHFRVRGQAPTIRSKPSSHASSATEVAATQPSDEEWKGEFRQFLGNDRTGIVRGVRISEDWTTLPPKMLWKRSIGAGWSGIAVRDAVTVTMEEHEQVDSVVAMGAGNGEILWRTKLNRKHYHALGGAGPRATPTIDGETVYVQSSTGIVAAMQLSDGKLLWSVDLLNIVGIDQAEAERAVTWGRSGSPLIDGERVIVPLGGKPNASAGGLIALDRSTGKEIWRGGTDQISYASPLKVRLRNEDQIVIVNESSVSAHNPETGELLWEYAWPGQSNAGASVSQPIWIDENRLFLSKGYHTGAMVLSFSRSTANATIITCPWKDTNLMKSKFTNPVLKDGYVYGLSDGILECVRVDDGKRMWKDSRTGRFGHGQLLLVGEHLLIATEAGELVLAQAAPEKPHVFASYPVLDGITWNSITLVNDRVYMRNGQEAACLRIPLVNAEGE